MAEGFTLELGISLIAVFVSITFNLFSIAVEFIGYKIKKIAFGNFSRLVFFMFSWGIVAFLNYVGYKEAHAFGKIISDTFYLDIVIITGVIIMWALDLIYFKDKIDKTGYALYISAGSFVVLYLVEKIVNYFVYNFYLELVQGITIIIPSIIVLLIVINSIIKNKKKKR